MDEVFKGFGDGFRATPKDVVKHFALGFNPDLFEGVKVIASGLSKN